MAGSTGPITNPARAGSKRIFIVFYLGFRLVVACFLYFVSAGATGGEVWLKVDMRIFQPSASRT